MAPASSLLVLAACLALLWAPAHGVTWNQTTLVAAPASLAVVYGIPDGTTPCNNPGICAPYQITLPPQTTWYWCGFRTEKRTQYWLQVVGKGANITGLLMRSSELNGCALPSPGGVGACGQIDTSLCDTAQSCHVVVTGMVFPDESCLLVSNNDAKGLSANVTIQIWNYDDHARLVGTVFTIIITIVTGLSILAYFIISCPRQYKRPTHRLDDLLALERQLSKIDDTTPAAADAPSSDAPGGGLKARFAQLKSAFVKHG